MKTMKYLVGAAIGLTMVVSSAAQAQIQNSAHDLTTLAPGDEICVYCHTPHNGNTAIPAPLWNRDIASTVFAMYTSPTLNMSIATDPQAISLACLSCHDGVTAYNNILNGTSSLASTVKMTGARAVGADGLTNDHPISVTYDTAADTDFKAATGLGSPGANVGGLPLYDRAVDSADQVECATCHNPHLTTNGSFLRLDNADSALCLTCHNK